METLKAGDLVTCAGLVGIVQETPRRVTGGYCVNVQFTGPQFVRGYYTATVNVQTLTMAK